MTMRFVRLAAVALCLGHVLPALAQDYPTRAIRLVIPFPPGGGNDVVGRIVAAELGERLGKQIVVDNRGGAAGVVGTEVAAAAPPDGYTLLVVASNHATNPWQQKIRHDPIKSFTPVAMLATGPVVLCANPEVPVRSVAELVALARSKPGQLFFANGGEGGFQHLIAASLASAAGIDVVHVPFKGGAPAMIDVIGGRAQFLMAPIPQVRPHLASGKLRALGIGSAARSPSLSEVPTIAEQGISGYTAGNWWGIVGPAGLAPPIVERLHKEISIVLTSPQTSKRLQAEGAEPLQMSTAGFAAHIATELARWGEVSKKLGKAQK